MKTRLQTSLGQQLVLTPQLQQAIKLLQMSTTELELEIAQAVESNPLLDWADSNDSSAANEGSDGNDNDAPAERTDDGDDWAPAELDWTPPAAVAASTMTTTPAAPPSAWPKPKRWPTTCCGSCTCRICPRDRSIGAH
jgi:DNA-directed RNA polymerase specialized sigma54-like protein